MDTRHKHAPVCVLLQVLSFYKAGYCAILHDPAVEPKARFPLDNLDQGRAVKIS